MYESASEAIFRIPKWAIGVAVGVPVVAAIAYKLFGSVPADRFGSSGEEKLEEPIHLQSKKTTCNGKMPIYFPPNYVGIHFQIPF